MLEPAVTLTDFALFVLNAWLAARILRVSTSLRGSRRHWVLLFGAIAAGALAGAISHGWFPEETRAGHVIWRVTMLLIGVAGVASFLVASSLVFRHRFNGVFVAVASVAWMGYAVVILFVRSDFATAVMFYVPSALLLLIAFVRESRSSRVVGVIGALGMLLTFVAAWIQSSGVAIHPKLFDHNATYHVVQAAGLILVYRAGRLWLENGAPPQSSAGGC